MQASFLFVPVGVYVPNRFKKCIIQPSAVRCVMPRSHPCKHAIPLDIIAVLKIASDSISI